MRVLVYGATGSQAHPIVQQLLDRGHQPRVLTRDPAKSAARFAAGVDLVHGDLSDAASLLAASRGVDAVAFMIPAFLSDPENALLYTEQAIQAAAAGGARLVVWNTSGRFPEPGEDREVGKAMLATRAVLEAGGLPLITVAPTTYMENLLGPWTVNGIRSAGRVAYPVLANRKMGWIASRDVCALMVAALERPQLAGRVFRVSGVEALTGSQLAAAFSAVLGRPLSYYTLSPAEMKAELEKAFGPGSGDEVAGEYALDQADPHPPAKYYDMSAVLADLPVRMTSIREWIAANAAAFTER
ncbi:MAG TPA: NmrA family NAD(P)-binding protein [Steroidobacteraceae bacterium]|nr:NmrA family NAD(P)-binding protein [Steroidobacteraceae bacterium]